MKNLKNLSALLLLTGALVFSSCKNDKDKCADVTCKNGQICLDGTCSGGTTGSTNEEISSNITVDTEWTPDHVYELAGRITVEAGATLTIKPGTVIKGRAGTNNNASALLIAKGAKIMANGTASLPIIFTSISDNITPAQVASGDFASPNLKPTVNALWGGVLILGNAPISASVSPAQIEGIPTTDQNGLYGGTNPADGSGSFTYVSIRHGGTNIGNGNEINGLTLGGVGSGTTISHVEIIGNQDDGVEFFGGTVNASNIIVLNAGDDAIDTDQAWAGTLDNFIVITGAATDHGLEIDGPEGSMLAGHTIKNGSIKGNSESEMADFRKSARGNFSNLYFFGFTDPATAGKGDFSLSSGSDATFASGDLTFSNLEANTGALTIPVDSIFLNGTSAQATLVTATTKKFGADKAQFAGWTWVNQANLLTDF